MSLYDQHLSNVANGAIALLGSATIDMKTAASTTIFSAARPVRITHVVVRNPTASLAGGTSYAITGWVQAFSLVNIITPTTGYGVLYAETSAAKTPAQYTNVAAGTNVQLTVTTGSTAVANATVDVFGYYA